MCAGDTETDAKWPTLARLITGTLVRTAPEGALHREWVAQPMRPIPEEAAAVHKYPTERAQAEGRSREDVIGEMEEWLAAYWTPQRPLIMYNAPFDLTLMDRELRRLFDRPLVISGPVLDPFVIDKKVDRYRPGERKLGPTCAYYSIDLPEDQAHSSLADTYAAGKLLTAVVDQYAWIRKMGPAKLHRMQIEWKREQAEGLLEFWRSKPDRHPDWRDTGQTPPQDVIDSWRVAPQWPIIPFDPETENLHEEAIPA